jgi:hypothetical protein
VVLTLDYPSVELKYNQIGTCWLEQ